MPDPAPAAGNALLPKLSATYNEDVVEISHPDGSVSCAVVTVSSPSSPSSLPAHLVSPRLLSSQQRCWADEQSPEALAEAARLGMQFTPLQPGYLEVLHPDGSRSEVLESATSIIDRGFLRGDLVRTRRVPGSTGPKSQAGQIVDMQTEVQLQRVLAPQDKLEGWFDAKELVAAARINRGDHVVHGDWVGLVEEVFEMAMIETAMGAIRRVCDTGTTLSVGPATEAIQNMLLERSGGFLANFMGAGDLRTILDVKQVAVAVNWLCKNQLAPAPATDNWERPKRYWTDVDQLTLVRATADHLHTIHDKVVMRDPTVHLPPASRHSTTFPYGHRIFTITRCRSTITVLWQDGTTTTGPSHEFEQLAAVDDETDVFPGDVGVFSGVTPSRLGVVQSMDARKRTIRMRYLDSPAGKDEGDEIISGLEFDPHGPPPDAYGVRRGDWVLIVPEGKDNGAPKPVVPSLGESETAAGLMPAGEHLRMEARRSLSGCLPPQSGSAGLTRLRPLCDTAFDPGALLRLESLRLTSASALAPINWYGEVWDLQLDGQALVRFPSGEKAAFPTERLIHLDDGMDPEGHTHAHEDGEWTDDDAMDQDYETDEGESDARSWETASDDEDGEGAGAGEEAGEEEDEEMGGEEDSDSGTVFNFGGAYPDPEQERKIGKKRRRSRRKKDEDEVKGWADDVDEKEDEGKKDEGSAAPELKPAADATHAHASTSDMEVEEELLPGRTALPAAAAPAAAASTSTAAAAAEGTAKVLMPGQIEDFADWSRFEVLEEAPGDHHYANEPVQVPSKSFMSRVRKEHGVLASSLPPNILVRAYENRSDLLRCLIIGPLGTPFQNAPFLFDVFLSPTKFPQEPPAVFFHSWAGGTRVSPNLYTEGKVCLSLLGTWQGDKTEVSRVVVLFCVCIEDESLMGLSPAQSWSAARSSILQVFVSIQALIMVEDPYFTEQIGTAEGTAASELYNERTLVLTRAFFKRACEYPPSNFSREIAAYYYEGLPSTPPTPGALGAIVEQCRALLEESERWHAEQQKEQDQDNEAAPPKPPVSEVMPSQRVLTEGAGLSLRRTLKALEELMARGAKVVAEP
ncbi:SPOSA6832_04405, partial [Sporobolomyces salmonicolor]